MLLDSCGSHYVAFLSDGACPNSQNRKTPPNASNRYRNWTVALIVLSAISLLLRYSFSHDFGLPRVEDASSVDTYSGFDHDEARPISTLIIKEFEKFVSEYNKVYVSLQERLHRLQIFARNYLLIELHNSENHSFTLAINGFADLTTQEFSVLYTGYKQQRGLLRESRTTDSSLLNVPPSNIPASIDWKERGCVTDVKDQAKCGSCWAFSAAAAVEGAHCVKFGELLSLSEQQLVDCARPEGTKGCHGGEMDDAFQYLIDRGGLCLEDEYPYKAKEGRCHENECRTVASIDSFVDVPKKNDTALMAAIALHGPVSVGIEADQLLFQFYHSGVFDAPCGKKLNHGVVVVGYGTEELTGKDYWLVKNSWGSRWGNKGFIKISRESPHRSGECGILIEPSFPVINKVNN